jgi:heptosyltransferase-1
MDTGLAHIGAALNVPMVTLSGPTAPALIGAYGAHSAPIYDKVFPCMPCYKKQCAVEGYVGPQAQCLKAIAADHVWDLLVSKKNEIS